MAVNSVSAAATAVQQQAVSPRQMPEIDRPRENNDAARGAREAQAAEQQAAQTARAEMTQRNAATEQQKPVVNAQGQKTGTIINTTA